MNKSAAHILLLVAVAPHLLAAEAREVTQSIETTGQGVANGSTQKREKEKGTFPSIPSSMMLGRDIKFGSYEVRTYRGGEDEDPSRAFEILKSGRRIYSKVDGDGETYSVGCINDGDKSNRQIRPGKDITGEGKPNLVISDWTGGAHCCFTYYIFELDDDVKEVGRINIGDGGICRFHKERNGKVDFVINDWTFAYWNASFNASPAPKIILRYQTGGYKVTTDLMVKPPPSREEFQQLVDKGRSIPLNNEGEPTSGFWGIMLELIYSGHADVAWRFCDESWPGSVTAKNAFLQSFRFQLSKSPYWPAIKAMNGL